MYDLKTRQTLELADDNTIITVIDAQHGLLQPVTTWNLAQLSYVNDQGCQKDECLADLIFSGGDVLSVSASPDELEHIKAVVASSQQEATLSLSLAKSERQLTKDEVHRISAARLVHAKKSEREQLVTLCGVCILFTLLLDMAVLMFPALCYGVAHYFWQTRQSKILKSHFSADERQFLTEQRTLSKDTRS